LRLDKIEDSGVTSHFEVLSLHDLLQAPRIGRRDNEAGIMSVCGPSPPCILQIHSQYHVATGTPSYVSFRRRGIVIAIFRDFGTNCMIPSGTWHQSAFVVTISFLMKGRISFETNVQIQWNSVYKAFHRIRGCGNEINCE